MSAETSADERRPSGVVLLLLAVLATVGLVLLLEPFLLALATSAVLAVLVYPAYAWLVAKSGRPAAIALAMTFLVVSIVILPAVAVLVSLLSNVESSISAGADYANSAAWDQFGTNESVKLLAGLIGVDATQLPELVGAKLREQAGPIATESLRLVSGFGAGLVEFGIIVFSLFFLLRDGPSLVERLTWLSPLDRDRSELLMKNARDAIFATVYGNIGVAAAQGALGGVAFALAGVPSAVFWGVVMGFLSLAPLVGATFVWLPASLWLLYTGEMLNGILLFAFGAAVISSVDNYLRALIVGERTELHPLAVFLSVLGGMALFGAAGVFLGPVLYVVSISMIEMARTALDHEAEPGALLHRRAQIE